MTHSYFSLDTTDFPVYIKLNGSYGQITSISRIMPKQTLYYTESNIFRPYRTIRGHRSILLKENLPLICVEV